MPPVRKDPPLRVKLEAALRQLGLEPHACELDHDPALGLREVAEDGSDWIPGQHDARYLVWRSTGEHKVKTFGTPATTAGSDIQVIAKSKRLASDTEQFRRRLLAKSGQGEEQPRPRGKIPSRPFPKQRREFR